MHDEYSMKVRQLSVITFRDANTVDSGSLNNCKEMSLTSGFKCPPQHSTSCILGIPRKSRDVMPEIETSLFETARHV